MNFRLNYKISALIFLILFPSVGFPWEKDEHKLLANSALDSVLVLCGVEFNDSLISLPGSSGRIKLNKLIWKNNSFGNVTAFFSDNDIWQSRTHERGSTIIQQLEPLTALYIDEIWDYIKDAPDEIENVEVSNQNVIYNYLLHHLIALRFADQAGKGDSNKEESIRYALIYEAVALGYLSDAFSSGHFVLQNSDFLAPLNYMNIQITHDYYCSEGLYVFNGRGDCWQTFGDKLLLWYPSVYSHVFEACIFSVRELFLVYFSADRNNKVPEQLGGWAEAFSDGKSIEEMALSWVTTNSGKDYYSKIKMPSLLSIPIPVSATWSVRTEEKDRFGIYSRKHYPQLSEENFHDPALHESSNDFLYSKNTVPEWMIPEFLPADPMSDLIKYNRDVASVEYIEDRFHPPSYEGYLLIAGLSYLNYNDENTYGTSIGLGWGFTDEFLTVIIKPTIFGSAMRLNSTDPAWIISADFGIGVNASVLGILKPHLEVGYAMKYKSSFEGGGGKYALGFDSETLPLVFTYAGLTFRFKYQFIFFDQFVHSPVLEIILH